VVGTVVTEGNIQDTEAVVGGTHRTVDAEPEEGIRLDLPRDMQVAA